MNLAVVLLLFKNGLYKEAGFQLLPQFILAGHLQLRLPGKGY